MVSDFVPDDTFMLRVSVLVAPFFSFDVYEEGVRYERSLKPVSPWTTEKEKENATGAKRKAKQSRRRDDPLALTLIV